MKRLFIALALMAVLSIPAMAAQTTITQEGAFDRTVRTQINDNFDELYAAVGGAFTSDVTITGGNLSVGNGTPDVTLNGEDAYIEGTLEVDGDVTLDSATVTINGGLHVNENTYFDDAYITGNATSYLWGFLQPQLESTTEAIPGTNCGLTYVSNSADVMTLPEASTVLGCRLTFVCGTADDFDINPADGTDTIGTVASITGSNTTTVLAPSAGDAIRCTDIGSSITLEAVGANLWASIGVANGIWTDVN